MKAFVICRDRVSYARQCVEALWTVGLEVHIVDHGSSWPPMLDWLGKVAGVQPSIMEGRASGPRVHVHWMANAHPRDLWADMQDGGVLANTLRPDERFVVTDCDVLPTTLVDWPRMLERLLDARPDVAKVGLGLRTDDLPTWYEHAERVVRWEAQWTDPDRVVWTHDVPAHRSPVDTTLAMYRRLEPFAMEPALRTLYPYVARHLSWYEDSAHPTDEQRWYRQHATPGVSHWADPETYEQGGTPA